MKVDTVIRRGSEKKGSLDLQVLWRRGRGGGRNPWRGERKIFNSSSSGYDLFTSCNIDPVPCITDCYF